MKSLHEFSAVGQIVEALPREGIRDLDGLRASLHVVDVPIRSAVRADIEASMKSCTEKAETLGNNELINLVVTTTDDVFKLRAITHGL
jgi:hypothetical protein